VLDNGLKDTQQELAWLWYERDSDLGVDVDSLVAEIKRYCGHYGFVWAHLKAEVRRK
jgi:hypothetical protein